MFKTYYIIGVWDSEIDLSWPWHFHYEHGVYLSEKMRKCKIVRAAKFDSRKESLIFFDSWVSKPRIKSTLKAEIIEVQERIKSIRY